MAHDETRVSCTRPMRAVGVQVQQMLVAGQEVTSVRSPNPPNSPAKNFVLALVMKNVSTGGSQQRPRKEFS